MSDDELLRITAEGDLVEEAKIALQAEMSKRKLTKDAVTKYQVDEQRLTEQNSKDKEAKTANFFGYGFEFSVEPTSPKKIEATEYKSELSGSR